MKILTTALLVMFVGLQYKLWFEEGNVVHAMELNNALELQRENNLALQQANQVLAFQIYDLKNGYSAIEHRARYDLGMVQQGEVFYRIIE